MGNFFFRVYTRALRIKFWIFALLLLVLAGGIYLATQKLKYQEDVLKLLPQEERLVSLYQASTQISSADRMLFLVSATDSTINPQQLIHYARAFADSLNQLEKRSGLHPITTGINASLNRNDYQHILHYLPVLLDSSDYQQITRRTSPGAIEKAMLGNIKLLSTPAAMAAKGFIRKDPLHFVPIYLEKLKRFQLDSSYQLVQNHIFTQNKKYLLFFAEPRYPSSNTAKNADMVQRVDAQIQAFQTTHPHCNIRYYGAAAVAVGNATQIKHDILFTVSLALLLLGLFMTLYYKRGSIFFILFLPAVFGGTLALAILYLTKGEISAISLGIGSILLGITVDYSLHLFTHYRKTGSAKKVLSDVAPPLLMSGLTTASAFLCLLFVRSEALHDLGLFAAISVTIAALFALFIMPLFFKERTSSSTQSTFITRMVDKITAYPIHTKKVVRYTVIALTLFFLFFTNKTHFEGDMEKMNYLTPELKAAEDIVMAHSSFALRSVYLITQGASLDEALQQQEKDLNALQQETNISIGRASAASMLLPSEATQARRIALWNQYWTPERVAQVKKEVKQAAAKYHMKASAFNSFFELLERSPKQISWEQMSAVQKAISQNFINQTDSLTSVMATLKLAEQDKPALYNHFSQANSNTTVFDKPTFTNYLVKALKDDFSTLVWYSMIVVFLILLIAYGRIELAIIAFTPMLLSWIWTLGIMGLLGIPFTIFNIIISTFIFGLGIDYAIFIMRGLMNAYKTGEDHLPSFKSSVFLSAVTTVLGIGVLIGAKHPSLQSMAALSLVGISSVVFISFTVEPALFSWFLLRRQRAGKPAYTLKQVVLSGIGYSIFAIGATHATLYGLVMEIFGIRSHRGQKLLHYLIMWSNRLLIYGMVNVKKRIINPFREDHSKPAIIIANHQSHLDLVLLMMRHPRFIILTNEWVQNHKIYGRLVRLAGYLPVSMGYEALAEALKPKVARGYSIVIFPEGTRSKNFKMKRFHKGAFFLAEKLQLDILPIALHGTGHAMTKGDDLLLKPEAITIEYLPRIPLDDPGFPTAYNKRAKAIGQYFRAHYQQMREKYETPAYYRDKLLKNYLYKGPVLEWYARVKTALEKNYHFFHKRLPAEGTIVDIGCGYGFLSYMLYFANTNRRIVGIDYDEEKIAVAAHIHDRNEHVSFRCSDITTAQLPQAEAFVLNDVLHYMPKADQQQVLAQCLKQLLPGGICIIREANAKLKDRHKGTKTTEFFSTRFFGFNKTADEHNSLYFPTDEDIFAVTQHHPVEVKVLDNSKHTSNVVYLITKKEPTDE